MDYNTNISPLAGTWYSLNFHHQNMSHFHLATSWCWTWAGILAPLFLPPQSAPPEGCWSWPLLTWDFTPFLIPSNQWKGLASRAGWARVNSKAGKLYFPWHLSNQPPLNYALLLIGMMITRAEQVDVVLCGGDTLKTAVLKAEEGILKTAIKLQAQVQVRHSTPTIQKYMKDTGLGIAQIFGKGTDNTQFWRFPKQTARLQCLSLTVQPHNMKSLSFRSLMKMMDGPWILLGNTCCLWLAKGFLWVLIPEKPSPSPHIFLCNWYISFLDL